MKTQLVSMLQKGLFGAAGVLAILIGSGFAAPFYSEDFEATDGGYTLSTIGATTAGPWTYGQYGVGGTNAWRADGGDGPMEQLLTSPVITVPDAGHAILSFDHLYNFEWDGSDYWDGGVVNLSVNGGVFTQLPRNAFFAHGYPQAIQGRDAWSMSGLDAFVGSSGTTAPAQNNQGIFLQSVADLGNFNTDDTLQIQFRGGWDWYAYYTPGWIVDNVRLTAEPVWNSTTDSNWSTAVNWNPNTAFPNAVDAIAILSYAVPPDNTVLIKSGVKVGTLKFENTDAPFILSASAGQSLTLESTTGTASILDDAGSHRISANIVLASDVNLRVANAVDTLTISGMIGDGGAGKGITKSGLGSLVLSGNNTYAGSTRILGGGIELSGSVTGGGAVTVNSGGFLSVPSTGNLSASSLATSGTTSIDVGATAQIGAVTVSGGTFTANAGTIGGSDGVTVFSGSVTLNNTNPMSSLVVAGGKVNTGPGAQVTTASVTGGSLSTQANDLAVGQSFNTSYEISGTVHSVAIQTGTGPAFGVKGDNLAANIDQVTLHGGTVTLSQQGAPVGVTTKGFQSIGAPGSVENVNWAAAPKDTFTSTQINQASTQGEFFSGRTGYQDNFAVEWRAFVKIDQAGSYGLSTESDDGSKLYIYDYDGRTWVTVATSDGDHPMQKGSGTYNFPSPGYYALRVRFYENGGGAGCIVRWTPPGNSEGVIPASVFVVRTPAAEAVNLPTTDVAVTASSTLNLNYAGLATLGNLTVSGGTLSFQTATGVSVNSITASGASAIAAGIPITLRESTVSVSPAGTVLTMNAGIEGNTGLDKTGSGTLTLAGSNSYTGGTTVAAGRLMIAHAHALPAGGSLSIDAGGTVVLASGLSAAGTGSSAAAAVPEPATLALLGIGAIGLLAGRWRRRRWSR